MTPPPDSLTSHTTRSALLVVAHPNPGSFSHAMASAARDTLGAAGYAVTLHDLYAEQFDPVQPTGEGLKPHSSDQLVEQHCADLISAELILVFHPNWWGQPPAILKGWVDRVFRLNTAYGYPAGVAPDGVPMGLLKARHALVFNTSNTPPDRETAVFGDPLENLWRECVFGLCGVSSVARRVYAPMASSTALQREVWLGEVRTLVRQHA